MFFGVGEGEDFCIKPRSHFFGGEKRPPEIRLRSFAFATGTCDWERVRSYAQYFPKGCLCNILARE